MFEDLIDDIKSRRNFYRDNYRKFSRSLYVCLCIIIVELVMIMLIFLTYKKNDYYIFSYDGIFEKIAPAPKGTRLKDPDASLVEGNDTNKTTSTDNLL